MMRDSTLDVERLAEQLLDSQSLDRAVGEHFEAALRDVWNTRGLIEKYAIVLGIVGSETF